MASKFNLFTAFTKKKPTAQGVSAMPGQDNSMDNKTPAQVLIRWALQNNIISIPKSRNPKRIEENFNVFDFDISQDNIKEMNSWNEDLIVTRDPEQMP